MVSDIDYDVILMDVLMSEMDGLEASKTSRKMSAHQPIIVAMTANAMPEDREECINTDTVVIGMQDEPPPSPLRKAPFL